MKKMLLCFSALLLSLVLFSCGSYDAKKSKLVGYESVTFYELLDRVAKKQIEDGFDEDAKNTYEITISENWDDADKSELDQDKIEKDKAAVTYTISFDLKEDDEHIYVTMKFFTLISKDDNTLRIKGLYFDEDGYVVEYYDKSEIESIIPRIFDELDNKEKKEKKDAGKEYGKTVDSDDPK